MFHFRVRPYAFRRLAALAALPLLSACQSALPPAAKVVPQTFEEHGVQRVDNYYWLKDRSDPDVVRYLSAENDYTSAFMKHTEPLQQQLFDEMKARLKETDLTVPYRVGDFVYYRRTIEGMQYPMLCRRPAAHEAPEQVILDMNALALRHDYFNVGAAAVSPDQRLLAYSTDTAGAEVYTLRVKDLASGQLLADEVPNTYYSVEWGNDNHTLFYTTLDDAKRPDKVWRHTLGQPASADQLVYQEADTTFDVGLEKTRSRKYIFIVSNSTMTTEVRFLDADHPEIAPVIIEPRQRGHEYSVEHQGEFFYITTNDEARNFRVMRAPVNHPVKANWVEFIAHRPDVRVEGVDAFAGHLVIHERVGGLPAMTVRNLATGESRSVEFPEPSYDEHLTNNEEYATSLLRFSYTSLVTPESIYDYDMNTHERTLLKQTEVLGGFDARNYVSERIQAVAPDGVEVPISLVYRKGFVRDGSRPCLLTGYGSYGVSSDARFNSGAISLLDRGFVYAIAHIRGGGEFGRPWYEDGKLLHKKNTFTDFIACAEHLIAEKYTSSRRLAITGGSAGGLLMGAVTNMRPDLFRAVVADVPFVDVINTMLDESIPLTTLEFDEWGNPKDDAYYEYIRSYSPYDNVARKAYPNMLVTAGLNDPRVGYWEPAKWVAKLRATKTGGNRLLLKTNMGAGHGGASGRYDRMRERAFNYAFIIDVVGK